MPAITTQHLDKRFDGVKAADKLSLAIPENKIIGLVGPNGSGKTTLTNILTGMVPFDAGTVVFASGITLKAIKPYDVAALGVTRTFQNIRLFEQMTVLDNLLVVLTKRSVFGSMFERDGEGREKRAKELLERVGIWNKRDELAKNLSYGQRKLLEISRALAMNPDVILLDEPFAGLFPEMVKLVKGIVTELRERGKTVLLIEHDMQIIRDLCDYVFVLDAGKLLAEGEPEAVLKKREVIEAYLGD